MASIGIAGGAATDLGTGDIEGHGAAIYEPERRTARRSPTPTASCR